ncbi:MAG: glycosyltransferase family 2 protein [wastewater metagenome]|nr:glycosyltransferase family 2 protein [Candidatus Loosdrechtia aerotolerans]
MKFSILVPAYNEEQSITSCIHSLIAIPDSKEIIIIDDASTDGTNRVVHGFLHKGIILVTREKNGGRAAALNSGLQMATGDIIVTTDADTVVPSDWLQRFEQHFKQQGIIAVGGAYQARNKDKPLAYAASILDQILNGIFKKSIIPNKLSGVNSAIRKNVLFCVGGFNENSWWCEDSELGWKLKGTGKILYDSNNIVGTLYPDTWKGIWKRKFYWGYAMGLTCKERIPFNIKLWLRPLFFMMLFVTLLTFLIALPYGRTVCLVSGSVFFLLLSTITILHIPFGIIVMIRNGEREFLRILCLLAVLPVMREFAYICGIYYGFRKGRMDTIRSTWKDEQSYRGTEDTKKNS